MNSILEAYANLLLDVSSDRNRIVYLFKRLFYKISSCQLFISNLAFEVVFFAEDLVLLDEVLIYNDDMDNINYVTEINEFLNNFKTKNPQSIEELLSGKSINILQVLLKIALDGMNWMTLKNENKYLLFDAIEVNDSEIFLNDNRLLEAYYQIPKYQRVPIAFFVNHFKK